MAAALCCSGCGSTHAVRQSRPTTHVAADAPLALPPAANLVILPTQYGAGDERLGTFTAEGSVYVELSCKGKGRLSGLTIVRVVGIGPCDGSPVDVEVPHEEGKSIQLVVHAKPGTTWRLAVGEHIPGATLVFVHSSGFGNKSFGTFRVRGTITVAISCKGTGNIDVEVTSTSSKHSHGLDTLCPQTPGSSFQPDLSVGRRVQIDVHAPRKVSWTISVSEEVAK